MVLTYYTFRLDINWSAEEELLKRLEAYIKANFPKYCIFKEIAKETKKEHLQGIIASNYKLTKVRKQFTSSVYKTLFTGTNYSIAEIKDYQKYISYCCKDNTVWINNVLTQEDINNYNKEYENLPVKVVKHTTFTQKVYKEYLQRDKQLNILQGLYYQYNLPENEKELLKEAKKDLLGFILYKLGCLVQVFDERTLLKMYNGILNKILQDDKCSKKNQLEHWTKIIIE